MRRRLACAAAMVAAVLCSAAMAKGAAPSLDGYAIWVGRYSKNSDREEMRLVRLSDGRLAPNTKPVRLAPDKLELWAFTYATALRDPLVVYGSGTYDRGRLHLVDLRRSTDRVIGTHDGYTRVVWSPTGKQLAAIRGGGQQLPAGEARKLSLIDLESGRETDLGAAVAEEDFTADGKTLVFAQTYFKGHLADGDLMRWVPAPPSTSLVYFASSPPGAEPMRIGKDEAARLLGGIYPDWLTWLGKKLGPVSYESQNIGMSSWFSPDRSRMLIMGLEVGPVPAGTPPTVAYYPDLWGIMDRKGRYITRFHPGLQKGLRIDYEKVDYLGWSPDGRWLYACIPKSVEEDEVERSYAVTVDTRTGKVRRQRLRWLERRGGSLLAYYQKASRK